MSEEFISFSDGREFISRSEIVGVMWESMYMGPSDDKRWRLKIIFKSMPSRVVSGADIAIVMNKLGLPDTHPEV